MVIDKREVATNQDQKINLMLKVIAIGLVAFLATGTGLMISFGAVKTKVDNDHEKLLFVSRDYMPAWYGENMVKLMTLHTDRVVAAIKGQSDEVARLNDEFEQTMKIINDNFIRYRGGMTTTTRGGVIPIER